MLQQSEHMKDTLYSYYNMYT